MVRFFYLFFFLISFFKSFCFLSAETLLENPFSENPFSEKPFYYFKVPNHWKSVDLSKFPKTIKSAFVAPSKKNFKPSINLAIEPVDVSLQVFIQAAKKQHTINRKNRWSEVGYISTLSGKAHVAQIDSKRVECGHVKMLQSILVKDGAAYTLTAVASQEDFLDYHDEFLRIFESFHVCPNLEDSIQVSSKKIKLHESLQALKRAYKAFHLAHSNLTSAEVVKHKQFIKNHLKPFDHIMKTEFEELGLAWNYLASKKILDSLESNATPL